MLHTISLVPSCSWILTQERYESENTIYINRERAKKNIHHFILFMIICTVRFARGTAFLHMLCMNVHTICTRMPLSGIVGYQIAKSGEPRLHFRLGVRVCVTCGMKWKIKYGIFHHLSRARRVSLFHSPHTFCSISFWKFIFFPLRESYFACNDTTPR